MRKNSVITMFSILVISLILNQSANAMQEKIVTADSEVEAFISVRDLTRIKAVDDRIRAVRAGEGEIEIAQDKQLGEVYLKPMQGDMAPINIFITTEKGFTYKLLMIPRRTPSEQIVLKNSDIVGIRQETRAYLVGEVEHE